MVGGAAMVLAKESDADEHGAKKLARIVGLGVAACDPHIMGWGPVPATRIALEHAGITGDQLDHVELNEAFAPQALACIKDFEDMGIDPEKINTMGNAIALGHPLGATGAVLTLPCMYALRRKGEKYGLVTMCIGGGQGIALILESLFRRLFEVTPEKELVWEHILTDNAQRVYRYPYDHAPQTAALPTPEHLRVVPPERLVIEPQEG